MRAHETNAFRTSPLLLSVLSVMRWVGVPGGIMAPGQPNIASTLRRTNHG